MRELREGLWQLEPGVAPPLDVNAYLLDEAATPAPASAGRPDDGPVTLVDAGPWYRGHALEDELAAAGYDPADVDRVVLTHYDLGHAGGLDRVGLDCPVYMGRADVALMRGERDPPLFHHKGIYHRLARRFLPVPDRYDLRPVTDGDRLGRTRAFHTPGHTPGHVAYVHDSGVAFLGDLLQESDGSYSTPFWTDSYDMRQLRESVRRFARRTPDFEVACVGHGVPFVERGAARMRAFAAEL